MKIIPIFAATVAALALAACGSTANPTPPPATPTSTLAATPTASPTPNPTPSPTPTTSPTPKPSLSVYVTVSCSTVLDLGQFATTGYPPGSVLAKAIWYNLTLGDYFGIGLNTVRVTATSMSTGVVGFGNATNAFTQGKWNWAEWSGAGQQTKVASGTLIVPACTPIVRITACDHKGTASGGAIAWSEPSYKTLTVTGPAPSTSRFTLSTSAAQYGPLTAGTYTYQFKNSQSASSGTFTVPACSS